MNEQEAYSKSVGGLASQGFFRSTSHGGCKYQSMHPDRKCAIGWLIDDTEYTPMMEGHSVRDLIREGCLPELETVDLAFLDWLQRAHDRAYNPRDMKSALRCIGAVYRLEIPDVLKESIR